VAVKGELLVVRVKQQVIAYLQLSLVFAEAFLVVLAPALVGHVFKHPERADGLQRDVITAHRPDRLLVHHHHFVWHDLADPLVAAEGVLHEQFVEDLDLRLAGRNEVEAFQGDLALMGLRGRFHEMLRGQAAQVRLGGLGVGQPHQGNLLVRHALLSRAGLGWRQHKPRASDGEGRSTSGSLQLNCCVGGTSRRHRRAAPILLPERGLVQGRVTCWVHKWG
jgi:hypothetical protein